MPELINLKTKTVTESVFNRVYHALNSIKIPRINMCGKCFKKSICEDQKQSVFITKKDKSG